MKLNRYVHMESIYVRGSHEEFTEAIADKLRATLDKHEEPRDIEVTHISHSMAIEGHVQHWSAFVIMQVTLEGE